MPQAKQSISSQIPALEITFLAHYLHRAVYCSSNNVLHITQKLVLIDIKKLFMDYFNQTFQQAVQTTNNIDSTTDIFSPSSTHKLTPLPLIPQLACV
jgi:hypothetical protein